MNTSNVVTLRLKGGRVVTFPSPTERAESPRAPLPQPQPEAARDLAAAGAMHQLRHFIGTRQLRVMRDLCRGEEGDHFRAKLAEIAKLITTMPKVYEQDGKGDEAIVYLHYFIGSGDWHITERDTSDEQLQAFGLADLHGDGGELGYICIQELIECGAELDLYWTPKTIAAIRKARA